MIYVLFLAIGIALGFWAGWIVFGWVVRELIARGDLIPGRSNK